MSRWRVFIPASYKPGYREEVLFTFSSSTSEMGSTIGYRVNSLNRLPLCQRSRSGIRRWSSEAFQDEHVAAASRFLLD